MRSLIWQEMNDERVHGQEALSHFKKMGGGSWLSNGGVRVITDTGTFIANGGTNWDEL